MLSPSRLPFFRKGHGELYLIPVPNNRQLHAVARFVILLDGIHFLHRPDILACYGDKYVPLLYSRLVSTAVRCDFKNIDTYGKAILAGNRICNFSSRNTDKRSSLDSSLS